MMGSSNAVTPVSAETPKACVLRSGRVQDRSYILQAEEETAAISFRQEQTALETQSRIRRLDLALESGSIVVAEGAGRIAGYCWIEKTVGGIWFLVDFYVDRTFRNSGVADWLLRCGISARVRAEAKVLRLVISDHNDSARRFFARHGALCKDEVASGELREYELPLEGAV